MKLKCLDCDFTVCKLDSTKKIDLEREFCFFARTDEEISLVCRTKDAPETIVEREDGWKAFRIQGVLDFSLIGILSRITGVLADHGIGLFAVSTYNTDYVLVKRERFDETVALLKNAGYEFEV